MTTEWRPRLMVDLEERDLDRFKELVPHGVRTFILQTLIKEVNALLGNISKDTHSKVLGLLIQREVNFTQVLPTLKAIKRADDGNN